MANQDDKHEPVLEALPPERMLLSAKGREYQVVSYQDTTSHATRKDLQDAGYYLYIRADRVEALKNALEGLATDELPDGLCWCGPKSLAGEYSHRSHCLGARAALSALTEN